MALKADIIARLNELGIEFDPKSSKTDLEALLPTEEKAAAEASDETSESSDTENGSIQAYTVCDKKGRPHRVYSRAIHGDGFKDLASEYVEAHPNFTMKPTDAPAIESKKGSAKAPSLDDSVTVFDAKGRPHRTFSLQAHGKEYKKIASDYAATRPGWSAK